jgi:autotransporter strand-loop-strand O-heptosyltransferase
MINIEGIIEESYVIGMTQNKNEIIDLVNFLKDKSIKNVLEIGSDRGGSFYLWCKTIDSGGKKISVDLPMVRFGSNDYSVKERNKKMVTWSNNIFIIEGDSHKEETLLQVEKILNGEEIDLLFIDGDHTYEGVKKDYEMYSKLVSNNGVIVFHDIKNSYFHRNCGCFVNIFWDELKGNKIEFKHDKDLFLNIEGAGGIGVIKKENKIYKVNKDNSVFIIGAWIDTDEKKDILRKTILGAKEIYDSEIILVTHYHIDEDILSMVDYFIYDKDNPLLYAKDYGKYNNELFYFFKNDNCRVNKILPFRHDYTVWTSMRNACNFAKYLGKEYIFYLEYDCILDSKGFKDNFIFPLEDHDACVFSNFGDDANTFYFNLFSIRTDILLEIINKFKNKDDYFSFIKNNLVETIFSNILREITNKVHLSVYQKDKMVDSMGVFGHLRYIFDNVKIYLFPCKDENGVLYFLLTSDVDNSFELVYHFKDEHITFEFSNKHEMRIKKIGDINDLQKTSLDEQICIKYKNKIVKSFYIKEMIEESNSCFIIIYKDNKEEESSKKNQIIDNNIANFYENIFNKKNIREIRNTPDFYLNHNFIDAPFVEIISNSVLGPFDIKFIDQKENEIIYQDKIMSNHWTKVYRRWVTDWKIQIEYKNKNEYIYFNPEGKKIFVSIESDSLGDSLGWMPYVEEFRKKYNCKIVLSTFRNWLFEKEYPEIEFVKPGSVVHNIYAQYNIGWYTPWDNNKNPNDFRIIPLQQTASDILGLDYKEIKPKITIPNRLRNIEGKYVCIGIHSTCQAKYWNYLDGWQKIVDYLNSRGYGVVAIHKEKGQYMGNTIPSGIIDKSGDITIEDRIVDLKYANMFIGVGSGLSWLAWAVGTPLVMISGFSKTFCEFTTGVERIHNTDVCNGCFNDPNITFDPGDWNWCPRKKNFECTKSITPEMVILGIEKILGVR